MLRSLAIIVAAGGLLACARNSVSADRGVTLLAGDSATCRPIGPAHTIATGWRRAHVHAASSAHDVTFGFFQMPNAAMAISVDPWEGSVQRETRKIVSAPPARVVPLLREDGEVQLEHEIAPPDVLAIGSGATLVTRQNGDAIEWIVRLENGRNVVRSLGPSASEVALEEASAIGLPDGRFVLAFVHVCSGGRSAMILTLDREGRPLGDPTALWNDGDAFEPRIARAGDGRAMVAFFDGAGHLRGVPIACDAAL